MKSKVSRLRDWNSGDHASNETRRCVEIKSFSITRLKLDYLYFQRLSNQNVEIKSFSITRLKLRSKKFLAVTSTCWNQKFLDYEIETCSHRTWNFRSLLLKSKVSRLRDWNLYADSCPASVSSCWNQKFLDYEIETYAATTFSSVLFWLKSKVSRLRDWNRNSEAIDRTYLIGWNQKFLDYEIETCFRETNVRAGVPWSWNQKFLDYEIETSFIDTWCIGWCLRVEIKSFSITRLKRELKYPFRFGFRMLKSKVSRLRDWNATHCKVGRLDKSLKSKVSRLRDWNTNQIKVAVFCLAVEIKSFSITRLKPTKNIPLER